MSEVPSSMQPLSSVSPLAAVLSFCAATVAGLLAFLGARFTATAPLQLSLNDAFRSLMDEWQVERARLTARVFELEGEVLRQRGTINQGLAREAALMRRIERMGGG